MPAKPWALVITHVALAVRVAHGFTLMTSPPRLACANKLQRLGAPLLLAGDDVADVVAGAADAVTGAADAVAASVENLDAAVVTDTILDLAVYSLLAGVVALSVFSIVVTLQRSNEEYGGWTPRDDEDLSGPTDSLSGGRLRPGAVYDPVTDKWTYPTKAPETSGPRVGRAPASNDDETANRYDRRMEKKRKRAQKGKSSRR
eukprot:CAMPEP_0174724038 /NCGR_PEP_ID=MMETSP1094-20130205/42556_1 /TAXON_ID=156173 /ORGANISM="Chrysochromulina brevifilum, Strain UTEX LB 985" /LENGTH=201 /DNA_ID=CAMNT_0015925187 /DNA_START=30 /DNA_END=635 /DNA_ORIENTATION=-